MLHLTLAPLEWEIQNPLQTIIWKVPFMQLGESIWQKTTSKTWSITWFSRRDLSIPRSFGGHDSNLQPFDFGLAPSPKMARMSRVYQPKLHNDIKWKTHTNLQMHQMHQKNTEWKSGPRSRAPHRKRLPPSLTKQDGNHEPRCSHVILR